MKYALYFILWLLIVANFILQALFKVVLSICIILWDFKFIKKRHFFWNKVHIFFMGEPSFY